MHPVPPSAKGRLGVFSIDEAFATGWTPDELRHAVRRDRLERLRPGVYRLPHPAPPTKNQAARERLAIASFAAGLANPSAAVSHSSAAILHELAVWHQPERPCMTVPPHFVGDIERTHLHRAHAPAGHVGTVGGVATSTIARAVIDIGRESGPMAALVTADAALHAGLVDVSTLRRRVRRCGGWPGVRAARQAIEFADGRSESPLESVSRFKLDGQVPTPELQVSIFGANGEFLGRPDFYWDEAGVIGEADGMLKYDDDPRGVSLHKEKVRQEQFERTGLIVVRWGQSDLANIDALVERFRFAFARGLRRTGSRRWQVLHQSRSA